MITFFISLLILLAAYFIYGRTVEKIFGIDAARTTLEALAVTVNEVDLSGQRDPEGALVAVRRIDQPRRWRVWCAPHAHAAGPTDPAGAVPG